MNETRMLLILSLTIQENCVHTTVVKHQYTNKKNNLFDKSSTWRQAGTPARLPDISPRLLCLLCVYSVIQRIIWNGDSTRLDSDLLGIAHSCSLKRQMTKRILREKFSPCLLSQLSTPGPSLWKVRAARHCVCYTHSHCLESVSSTNLKLKDVKTTIFVF